MIQQSSTTLESAPNYLSDEIMMHPEKREFPPFDVVRLLSTVFEPTQGCRVCILTDFDEPQKWMKDFSFLESDGFEVQKNAIKHFYEPFKEGAMAELGMHGGEIFAYYCTNGSNLDMKDDVFDSEGNHRCSTVSVEANKCSAGSRAGSRRTLLLHTRPAAGAGDARLPFGDECATAGASETSHPFSIGLHRLPHRSCAVPEPTCCTALGLCSSLAVGSRSVPQRRKRRAVQVREVDAALSPWK